MYKVVHPALHVFYDLLRLTVCCWLPWWIIQTPSGNKNILQQQPQQSRQSTATLVVNHVYRSLPQTPLIGGTLPSVPHAHHLAQQEFLLGDHRRRSYGGEKGQLQSELAREPAKAASSRPAAADDNDDDDDDEEEAAASCDVGGDVTKDNGNSASGSRFKFRPLASSKSSENFHQLRRVAMATVNPIHQMIYAVIWSSPFIRFLVAF